jgi:hypothetical protein
MSTNLAKLTITNVEWWSEVVNNFSRFFIDLIVDEPVVVFAWSFVVDVVNAKLPEQVKLLRRDFHRLLEENPLNGFVEWWS